MFDSVCCSQFSYKDAICSNGLNAFLASRLIQNLYVSTKPDNFVAYLILETDNDADGKEHYYCTDGYTPLCNSDSRARQMSLPFACTVESAGKE